MSFLGLAVVRQYERGVVFRLGRLRNVRKPEGDFRPWDEVRNWAAGIGPALLAAADETAASA